MIKQIKEQNDKKWDLKSNKNVLKCEIIKLLSKQKKKKKKKRI